MKLVSPPLALLKFSIFYMISHLQCSFAGGIPLPPTEFVKQFSVTHDKSFVVIYLPNALLSYISFYKFMTIYPKKILVGFTYHVALSRTTKKLSSGDLHSILCTFDLEY